MNQAILTAALDAHQAGINVLPIRSDASKSPAIKWGSHTTTEEHIRDWFDGPRAFEGIGAACGAASGGLLMLEIEGDYVHQVGEVRALAEDSGLGELWKTMTNGWMEQSPSGGLHWLVRVEDGAPGSTRLARTVDDKVIAETRGSGGYTVLAPSHGGVHATGKPWVRLNGGPTSVPTLTADEAEALCDLFRTLNQKPEPAPYDHKSENTARRAHSSHDGVSPGDDYEQRTPWAEILTGWTPVFQRGNTTYWRRPGKNDGISATTGHADDRDRLYVFTTSTELPAEIPLTKFGVYAILQHGGDFKTAATTLKEGGYGKMGERFDISNIAPAGPSLTQTAGWPAPQATEERGDGTTGAVAQLADKRAEKAAAAASSGALAMTDDGLATAFSEAYSTAVKYHPEAKRWLAWTGTLWEHQPETGGVAREYAKQLARQLQASPDDKEMVRFKKRALSDAGISAMLNMARTIPALVVTNDQLDARPWELNTPTGIVNLRTGETLPHAPEKMHTKITTASPQTEASTPGAWHNFLASSIPDQEVRWFLQKLAGYSTIGEVYEHVLPFIHGPGGRGKGTFTETLKAALGSYASKAPSGFLMQKQSPEHSTEIAKLDGARFVLASEVNEKDRFDEQKVKELTGGDTLTARFMHRDYFDFTPSHTLWLMGNDKPNVETGGDAFWRRLRLIPFTAKVSEDERIIDLQNRLIRDHLDEVMTWIIDGAAGYTREGLTDVPETVRAETESYASETDIVGQFLEECCVTGDDAEGDTVSVKSFRKVYEHWCEDTGHKPLGPQRLAPRLNAYGVLTGRNAPRPGQGKLRLYGNVRIRQEVEAQMGAENTW